MNNSQIFRPLIQQIPGQPDPTSGDGADFRAGLIRPDPTKTGPCELELSFACTGAGYERLDPRDMLTPETSFRTPRIICVECNDMAATIYIRELHS